MQFPNLLGVEIYLNQKEKENLSAIRKVELVNESNVLLNILLKKKKRDRFIGYSMDRMWNST